MTSCELGLTQLAFRLDLTLLLNMRDSRKVFVKSADKQIVKLKLTPKRRIPHVKIFGFKT